MAIRMSSYILAPLYVTLLEKGKGLSRDLNSSSSPRYLLLEIGLDF